MPDQHRLTNELKTLLSRPQYASILAHRNEFRKPTSKQETPALIAAGAAKYLCDQNPLMNPVEVLELRGPLQLYRAHDGGASTRRGKNGTYNKSAGTLGGSWVERSVAEDIWKGTAKYGVDRKKWYMEFMRTANFVLPEWNAMLFIVCMVVPAGNTVVVVRGKGSWKAMKTPAGATRPGGAPPIRSASDVLNSGMMPIPGVVQCVVPLFNDLWVQPIDPNSIKWPFIS